jgi:membrane-associated protein
MPHHAARGQAPGRTAPADLDNRAPMDILPLLLDFILHVDRHLAEFVVQYGVWVYAVLFLIIFVETGLVVMPFLPGDSLLFVVGTMCGTGLMSLPLSLALLLSAAVAGNQTNYTIGHYFGPRVFQWENSRLFNKQAFEQAHAFYEKWGGLTLVMARFMPFVRTFAPFVAGVARMTRARFTFFDVTGGTLWVCSLVLAGYFFGNIPWVKNNLEKIIWAMLIVPGLLALGGALRSKLRSRAA